MPLAEVIQKNTEAFTLGNCKNFFTVSAVCFSNCDSCNIAFSSNCAQVQLNNSFEFYKFIFYKAMLRGSSSKMGTKLAVFVTAIGVICFPIIIHPMIDSQAYKAVQQDFRKDINQELIQPGNMKVWSDPFGRK